ncbi:hypothetical protein [Desulfurobacterium crinifex]
MPKEIKKPISFPMRAKKLNPKKIFKIVKAYLKERGQALINLRSKPKSRGRPKKYPDEIILIPKLV